MITEQQLRQCSTVKVVRCTASDIAFEIPATKFDANNVANSCVLEISCPILRGELLFNDSTFIQVVGGETAGDIPSAWAMPRTPQAVANYLRAKKVSDKPRTVEPALPARTFRPVEAAIADAYIKYITISGKTATQCLPDFLKLTIDICQKTNPPEVPPSPQQPQ